MSVRVLLADDQALVRSGFAMILGAQPDIEIVGESEDGEQAVADTARLGPDVVIMDIQMPKLDGVAATRSIAGRPDHARVIVVTTFDIEEYVYAALRAGASGFLLKNSPPEELVRAVRVVAAGDSLLAPKVTTQLIEAFCKRAPVQTVLSREVDQLTPRELEVLGLVAQGLSNSEIAQRLVVSLGTVRTHVAHILLKLKLRDRVQAVVLAYETGIVTPGRAEGR
jgi:DNA-binding NarL/FixJ family response regulator